jgi:hypothetical protein
MGKPLFCHELFVLLKWEFMLRGDVLKGEVCLITWENFGAFFILMYLTGKLLN